MRLTAHNLIAWTVNVTVWSEIPTVHFQSAAAERKTPSATQIDKGDDFEADQGYVLQMWLDFFND